MSLISLSAIHLVEKAINAALLQDQPSQIRLGKLAGQNVLLEIEDFSLLILIQILEEGIALSLPTELADADLDNRKDTHVSGTSSAYRKLLDGNGFFEGDLLIQGNAQTLMTLHKVSENFELDWEGILADKIGDLSASVVAELLRKKWDWSKNTSHSLKITLIDYLQNDSDLLPSKLEFTNFVEDLESFDTQLDRLDARLQLLKKKVKPD
ncbi:SCP2 domain-containing protein [Marinomonas sp. 2405UD68-3]|uniref:ubiquinone biosynthesis accessory factor UbiJ n=1 Tax=Marinomonas sp. 2405UD68-3 TaxID=3391835 RepID=UPI0039C91F0E